MHLLPKKIRKKAPFCNLFSISLYLSLFFSVCYITFFYFLTNCHVISCLHSTKFFLFYQKKSHFYQLRRHFFLKDSVWMLNKSKHFTLFWIYKMFLSFLYYSKIYYMYIFVFFVLSPHQCFFHLCQERIFYLLILFVLQLLLYLCI
jgi:hypothetical protein